MSDLPDRTKAHAWLLAHGEGVRENIKYAYDHTRTCGLIQTCIEEYETELAKAKRLLQKSILVHFPEEDPEIRAYLGMPAL